jgi:hypothetical protein
MKETSKIPFLNEEEGWGNHTTGFKTYKDSCGWWPLRNRRSCVTSDQPIKSDGIFQTTLPHLLTFETYPLTGTGVTTPTWTFTRRWTINPRLIRLIRVIDCGSFHLPHAHRGVGSLRSVSSETHVSPRQPDWRHRHKTWTWSIHYDRPVSKTCQTIAWQVKGERLVNLWTRLYKRQRGDRGTVCEHYWLYVDLAS